MNSEEKVQEMLDYIIDREREAVAKKLNSELNSGFDKKANKVDADVIDNILGELDKIEE